MKRLGWSLLERIATSGVCRPARSMPFGSAVLCPLIRVLKFQGGGDHATPPQSYVYCPAFQHLYYILHASSLLLGCESGKVNGSVECKWRGRVVSCKRAFAVRSRPHPDTHHPSCTNQQVSRRVPPHSNYLTTTIAFAGLLSAVSSNPFDLCSVSRRYQFCQPVYITTSL